MKGIKKGLAILLVLCTLLSMVVMTGAGTADTAQDAPTAQSTNDNFYKIVHLDCGRKYFSAASIKTLIDMMAKNDYNQLELAVGNAGLRFLLDDMSIVVSDTVSYTGEKVKEAIVAGNKTQNSSGDGSYLTETEMTGIIEYANEKGIEIVPLLNMPGHMNALLNVNSEYILPDTNKEGKHSAETLDLNNTEAYNFGLAVLRKYVNYFKTQGIKYFNFGADEYGNDIYNPYFSMSGASVNYATLVKYMNACAEIIKNAGMTPRAFNDFVYYNYTPGVSNDIQVCYWANQWSGSPYVSASTLASPSQGYTLINTNQDWYYVPGSAGYSLDTATGNMTENGYNKFKDGSTATASGAMVCIWCDNPNAATEADVLTAADTLISTFAKKNSAVFTVSEEPAGSVEVTNNKTINVTVNGTATDTISGADYSNNIIETELNKSIATVSADYEQVTGGTEEVKSTSITSSSSYYIKNSSGQYLSSDATWVNDISSAARWTATSSGNGYTLMNGNNYLRYRNSSLSTTTNSRNATTWTFSNGTFSYTQYSWGGSTTYTLGDAYTVTTTAPVNTTTVTFTGVALGTTYVTVGNTRYTINVVAENPAAGGEKNIVYLITGLEVTGSDGQTSKTISSEQVYGEEGVAISKLVPATGTYNNGSYNVKYWKTQYLTGNDRLPADSGWTNNSNKGTTITHIRYYGGQWSVKDTEGNWITVETDSDIAAYYLHKTDVTQEVTTYVVDWGDSWSSASALGGSYGLYDFAVVYPSSSARDPSAFGNANTMLFNAEGKLDYAVSDDNGTGRYVYDVQVEASDAYEVYMITAIRVGLSSASISSTTKYTSNYSENYYTANEQIVWVDDESSIPEGTEMTKYEEYYHVGGDPTIPMMKLYTKQAILFTYYLRVKPTDDSLGVHYIDQTTNTEFYGYDIAVKSGTLFDENIGLADPWKGNLANGSVTNNLNKTQTVSADLSTMPAIGAQYRYSDYTCVKVECSENGKDVYLYYTFNNTHSFVVDFGLPVKIETEDLGIGGNWTSATLTGAKYGTIENNTTDKYFTYTPTQVLQGIETLQLTLTGDSGSATHQIYIYPATTVYYEEGFAVPYPAGTENVTTEGTAQNLTQTTSVVGSKAHYGYDDAYASAVGDSNGTAMKLAAGAGAATFTFTGTGVDIYTSSTTDTGSLMIRVVGSNDTLVKVLSVNTVMQNGNTGATNDQAVKAAYHVPVVSLSGLAHGTYTLQIAAVKSGSAGAKEVYLDGFRVYGTLDSAGNAYHDEGGVYYKDNEDKPTFIELRDEVLTAQNVSTGNSQYANQIAENVISQVHAASNSTTGAVITSNNANFSNTELQDLLDNGPKNEIYLQPNQALTFTINTNREVQVGLKALNQETGYEIKVGEQLVASNVNFSASTDMFYTVLNKAENETEQTITITNKGTGILSITKLKVCDDPNATLGELTAEDLIPALVSLGYETEPVEAEAVLNITVQAGDQTVTAQLTATGIEGESHTFTAAEIKAAAEAALPEGYTLDGVTFEDVTVVCGAQGETSYTAAAVQNPTPDQPTKVLQKLLAVIKNIFERLFRWL